ncbi:MAG: DUF3127 domain-containing protein [Bacteroidales bacterium]|nr:DUF3127 domain-containing protein [Bacteroidales bacterium]
MEITGKVFRILPLVTGQGRNGEWRKQEFVLEIEAGQFPKKICMSLWGDKIDQAGLTEGETVKAFFDVESREYNGRWFTEAKAWRIEKGTGASQSSAAVEESYNPPLETASPADDLPF